MNSSTPYLGSLARAAYWAIRKAKEEQARQPPEKETGPDRPLRPRTPIELDEATHMDDHNHFTK